MLPSQSVRDQRVEQLEQELKNTRNEFRELMQPIKSSYAKAEGSEASNSSCTVTDKS